MRLGFVISACLAEAFGVLHGQQGAPLGSQASMGVCSPNISRTNGNVTIAFSGSACAVDPARLRGLEEFLKEFPKLIVRLRELLDKKPSNSKVSQPMPSLTLKRRTVIARARSSTPLRMPVYCINSTDIKRPSQCFVVRSRWRARPTDVIRRPTTA